MPSARSARSSERRRLRNRHVRSTTRTLMGKALDAVWDGEAEAAQPAVAQAIRALDKAVTKGILHKNNAARRKSRLMAKLHGLQDPGSS